MHVCMMWIAEDSWESQQTEWGFPSNKQTIHTVHSHVRYMVFSIDLVLLFMRGVGFMHYT